MTNLLAAAERRKRHNDAYSEGGYYEDSPYYSIAWKTFDSDQQNRDTLALANAMQQLLTDPEAKAAIQRLRYLRAGENPVEVYQTQEAPARRRGPWRKWESEEAAEANRRVDYENVVDKLLAALAGEGR